MSETRERERERKRERKFSENDDLDSGFHPLFSSLSTRVVADAVMRRARRNIQRERECRPGTFRFYLLVIPRTVQSKAKKKKALCRCKMDFSSLNQTRVAKGNVAV